MNIPVLSNEKRCRPRASAELISVVAQLDEVFFLMPDAVLLDEPTNHLDVDAKSELKKAVSEFKGTVLIVSHEPEFYEEWVTDIWNIEDWTTKIV